MISDYLSLVAAILALPSVIAIGFVILTESVGETHVKFPNWLVRIRTRMYLNAAHKWNTFEFKMRVWGFVGITLAVLLQIAALSIKICCE